ncbi:Eyes Absent-like 2 [Manis pentadactyla]|nr:Eyes Absent-like 2 [Manis pentadactyla]
MMLCEQGVRGLHPCLWFCVLSTQSTTPSASPRCGILTGVCCPKALGLLQWPSGLQRKTPETPGAPIYIQA